MPYRIVTKIQIGQRNWSREHWRETEHRIYLTTRVSCSRRKSSYCGYIAYGQHHANHVGERRKECIWSAPRQAPHSGKAWQAVIVV